MKSSTRKWLLLDLNHSCFNWTILLIIRVNMFSCCTRRIYRGFTKEKIATFKTKWYFYVLHSFYLLATSIHWEKCDIFVLKANISKNESKSVHALADTYIIHFINPDFFSIFKKFFPGLFEYVDFWIRLYLENHKSILQWYFFPKLILIPLYCSTFWKKSEKKNQNLQLMYKWSWNIFKIFFGKIKNSFSRNLIMKFSPIPTIVYESF